MIYYTHAQKGLDECEVAKKLRAVAAALSLSEGDNKFRIIAYNRAADAIEHASSEVKDLWDDGKLEELAGVGKTIAGYLDELFRTKKVKHWQEILSQFPKLCMNCWRFRELVQLQP